jgi:DNA-binding transcriptional regulator YiaG
LCEDTGEEFTDAKLDDLNLTQAYNQYRTRCNLPFPDEIKALREQYGLSAAKMSEILGFGANL